MTNSTRNAVAADAGKLDQDRDALLNDAARRARQFLAGLDARPVFPTPESVGGLTAFGLVGLFIGPVILAVLVAVWREWLAERAEDQAAA